MLQKYTKVFIGSTVLLLVPTGELHEELRSLRTAKKVAQWVKVQYQIKEDHTYEVPLTSSFWHLFLLNHVHIIAGGGWVWNDNGQLLVIERNGRLDLPKGKLSRNETIEECALREVEEECAIEQLELLSGPFHTYHSYKYKGEFALKTCFWYHMKVDGSPALLPQEEEGITAAYWAYPEQVRLRLKEMPTFTSLKEVFQRFIDGSLVKPKMPNHKA